MGAKESKPSCISYEEAVKRVTDTEFRRIREAFKRSSNPGGHLLSLSVFLKDVLCEGVPTVIGDWLFTACGGTQKGISFKDLLCGLVLLTRGTEEEKVKFLWNLYTNDAGTHISKTDFLKVLTLESTLRPNSHNQGQSIANTNVVLSLFRQSDRVTFDQFNEWILSNKSATVLSKWLLAESVVNLTSELETPTFYQSLAGVTHLEEQDIGDLEKVFWRLKNSSSSGQLDIESVGPLISPPIPKAALIGLFNAFDENRDGHIDFKELCCGVSAACRGPNAERSKFCFKVFDIDRDGVLNFKELNQMVEILIYVAKESSSANNTKTFLINHVINDMVRFSRQNKDNGSQCLPDNVCIGDNNQFLDFYFSQEDFMMWSIQSPLNLVRPFLDLFFEVCHIVFGLKPQCRHLEFDIVKEWLSREKRRGYKVGQFWYLIAADWWQSWIQYTQHYSATPCTYCKPYTGMGSSRNMVFGLDEAMICDESFTSNSSESMGDLLATADSSSLGSGSSGISYGRRHNARPGPIDNSNLITQNANKGIPSLTGEGGHLKKDTPLTQRYDFELVPESLWKALSRWYGDSLPLPRQVIQPRNSPDVEVELYPLNLKILRHHNVQSQVVQNTSSWGMVSGGYGSISPGSGYTTIATAAPQPPKKYVAYTAAFSRLATVKQIAEFLCEQLKLKSENIRLWHILGGDSNYDQETPCLLEEEHMILQELSINDGDQILLEVRNKDLTWPEELGSLTLANNISLERRLTTASIHSVHALGATGLHNLGNTCFMNAALQVLFNTQPLTLYFKKNIHLFELNTANKLGTKGQLATRYGELLKEVWTTNTRSIAPLKLRFCVTKHAPQFAGGGQHDTQELLEWLLDALHEDLNRVADKPYMELKDSAGRPDEIVAAEAWSYHHSRNQSIVIDMFYGQLKSKVSCLCCGRESVRFDPFSLLSLPLPVENFIYCEVLVILMNGSVPVKYGLRLNADSKYFDLKKALSPLCNINPYLLLVCEISNSQIKTILPDDIKVSSANATDLVAYQLPEGGDDCQSRSNSIIGINIEKGLKDIQRNSALMVALQQDHHASSDATLSTTSNSINNDNEEIKQLSGEIEYDKDSSSARTSKQSAQISTSPESTFSDVHLKRISATKLLSNNVEPIARNGGPASLENNSEYASEENYNACDNDFATVNCPCRSLSSDRTIESEEKLTNYIESEQKSVDIPCNVTAGRYLLAVHRKLTRQDTYFLSYHKTRPSLFGVPLLIPCYENGTNKDLYCGVWMQVNRLLSPLPLTPDQANHAADCDDSLGYDFPFTLRAVANGGLVCALCPWSNFCRGCEIPCNDDILFEKLFSNQLGNSADNNKAQQETASDRPTNVISSINIAIDWDPTALHLRYQSTREKLWTEHESVAICRRQQTEPVDLNYCLRAFTSEEKLEQWYHCSHCKGKKPATKKLQIWKLPPILIIHLKRFNCVNGKWVKSQKVVNFPFEDFDPTPYLASVPQETILRHKELLEMKSGIDKTTVNENTKNDISQTNRNISNHSEQTCESIIEVGNESMIETAKENHIDRIEESGLPSILESDTSTSLRKMPAKNLEKRKRLISTSLTKTPIIDGHFVDFHQHKLTPEADPFNLKYDLYAVVSHSGMLNGGHYVSFAANPNGSWYCYNDSSCREIRNRPNIDPSSAYLLLYERKNLDYEPYLPNIEGRSLPNGNLIDTDDMDGDKKTCVIS
ncbi:unnamed protein product [Hermetia illucens]|uniref:ubiquitinyl hydrolase 1 n=1 Tax=Hermetia illucens TaxID=343691 RepID=A0A7R8UIJ4_HERIL|nr:ubiquitin carboxyl-terminal hydrolase 32 isoform X3 [Hermetia illucens]CAD7081508.1 unnamed protein product [Hermetia illucens]